MKQTLLLTCCLVLSATLFAQSNIFPDTFPNVKGYKYLTVRTDHTCSSPIVKSQVTAKYYFDTNGNTEEVEYICDSKVCGRHRYTYANNQLVKHQNYNTWTSPGGNEDNPEWDSTELSNEITFTWQNNRLTGFRDHVGYMERDFIENKFAYDTEDRIASEEMRTNYDSMRNNQLVNYALVDRKDYSYKDTIININYYRNNKLVSKERIIKNRNGLVLKSEVKRLADGKVLQRNSYKYNGNRQPVEINSLETGYDGFGNTYDFTAAEKTVLEYDTEGRLASKKHFYKGRLCTVEKFSYIK